MRNKERGQARIIFPSIIAMAIFALVLVIIVAPTKKKHRLIGKHVAVRGEFLKPVDGRGRYAYQSDDGLWWIYNWNMNNFNGYYISGADTGTSSLPSYLPIGGSWTKATSPIAEEDVVGVQEEEIAETVTGQPETEAEWATQNETGIENQSVEPETTEPSAEPAPSPEPAPSAEPSSSPGDTSAPDTGDAGGGDGGGDGGGGCMRSH